MTASALLVGAAALAGAVAAPPGAPARPAVPEKLPVPMSAMRVKGWAGERLDACIRTQMSVKDVDYLATRFEHKTESGSWGALEPGIWQTEFWGKYMQAAVPMATGVGDRAWLRRLDGSVRTIVGSQLDDGYVGNYRPASRGEVCDVWGAKYVMMGLMHWYDAVGDRDALKAAERLGGWLKANFGEGRRSLAAEGPFNGLMNGSVLEPVMWLYYRTGDRAWLDYAGWIVRDLGENPKGPELFRLTEAKTPLAKCKPEEHGHKAYEKMSCVQGYLDYYSATGDERVFRIARAIAEQVAAEEIDIAGAGTSCERFGGFAAKQARAWEIPSEICVVITWMRLCERMLTLTDDPKWADELERTFYNAYLGALAADGSSFASYSALAGIRERIHPRQCRMWENCCSANGARGFVAFCESAAMRRGDEIWLNQYLPGIVRVGDVELDQFNDYPRGLSTSVTIGSREAKEFTLHVRVPAWSRKTVIELSDGTRLEPKAGAYAAIRRKWEPGDQMKVTLDGSVRRHVRDGHVAFTRGPVALARDVRFRDGDLSEPLRLGDATPAFRDTLPPDASMRIAATAFVGMGMHREHPERAVGFCDYASAGNTEDMRSFYRVWLPLVGWDGKEEP